MSRVQISPKMARNLCEKNANSCCVCKRTGIGLNFHHIDGDSSNTTEDNLAVLCVSDHDLHHRPQRYSTMNHMNLSAEKMRIYKMEWEAFVQECKKENPQILAVISTFGTDENIVGMKILFQWVDGREVFERTYQQLDGDVYLWIDKAMKEVLRFGKNIKIVLINKALPIEYCEKHRMAMSRILDEPMAKKVAADDWKNCSVAGVYINPDRASLAISIIYKYEEITTILLCRCGNKIKYVNYKQIKSAKVKKLKVRKQVKAYVKQILEEWDVGKIFYGTGNPQNPYLVKCFELPVCWE